MWSYLCEESGWKFVKWIHQKMQMQTRFLMPVGIISAENANMWSASKWIYRNFSSFVYFILLVYNNNNNNDRLTAFDLGQPG